MSRYRVIVLTTLTMMAFTGNSLLCRLALKTTNIDALSFTSIRLLSGAVALLFLSIASRISRQGGGTWSGSASLFIYAVCFSLAYVKLSASTGALLLFGAVQATMIGFGIWTGERLRSLQIVGFIVAIGGLIGLLLPGVSAPPVFSALLMLCAGVAWGAYSILGKRGGNPTWVTTGNFLRAFPVALLLSLVMDRSVNLDVAGAGFAIASGALTSGVGYAIWYAVLPSLRTTVASTVQLSVPVITALGGIIFLGESLTSRLVLSSAAIIGGIWLVLHKSKEPKKFEQAGEITRR